MIELIQRLSNRDLHYAFQTEVGHIMNTGSPEATVDYKIDLLKQKLLENPELVDILASFIACDRALENRIQQECSVSSLPTITIKSFPDYPKQEVFYNEHKR